MAGPTNPYGKPASTASRWGRRIAAAIALLGIAGVVVWAGIGLSHGPRTPEQQVARIVILPDTPPPPPPPPPAAAETTAAGSAQAASRYAQDTDTPAARAPENGGSGRSGSQSVRIRSGDARVHRGRHRRWLALLSVYRASGAAHSRRAESPSTASEQRQIVSCGWRQTDRSSATPSRAATMTCSVALGRHWTISIGAPRRRCPACQCRSGYRSIRSSTHHRVTGPAIS